MRFLDLPNILYENGLSESEFSEIEHYYSIKFPPDLRVLLAECLPVSSGFINWRNKSHDNLKEIKSRIELPKELLIWDIKENDYWSQHWPEEPKTIEGKIECFLKIFSNAPKLIPVYTHRYIPSEPMEKDNPIISMQGFDSIYYGENIEQYLINEFIHSTIVDYRNIKIIKFWTNLVEENDE